MSSAPEHRSETPISQPHQRDPYVGRQHAPEEAQWFLNIAIEVAEANGHKMAKGQMRRRTAHEYFILAHLDLYADGVGDDEAARLLDELAEVFRAGMPRRRRVA